MGLLRMLLESMHVCGQFGVGNRQEIGRCVCPDMGPGVRDWTVGLEIGWPILVR